MLRGPPLVPHPMRLQASKAVLSSFKPHEAMALSPGDASLSLRLFIDHTIAEAYWQGGRVVLSVPLATSPESAVELSASVPAVVLGASAWRVAPIWVSPEAVLRAR